MSPGGSRPRPPLPTAVIGPERSGSDKQASILATFILKQHKSVMAF